MGDDVVLTAEAAAGDRAAPEVLLGLIAAPGEPARTARLIQPQLVEELSRRFGEVTWRVEVVEDGLMPAGASGLEVIDRGRRFLLDRGWDLAVILTDLPLRIGARPVVAHASTMHAVGLVSVPALGALALSRRTRDSVLRLVEGLLGESLALDGATGDRPERRWRLGARLRELSAPDFDPDRGAVIFAAAVLRGHIRLLIGMVRNNRPWRLVAGLSRALAAAGAAVAFALIASDLWRLADGLNWLRLAIITVASLGTITVSLIAAHSLWERRRDDVAREQIVLFNLATTATVLIGVAALYTALFLLTLAGAAVVVTPELMRNAVGHPVDVWNYLRLAWLASSLATVAGALGAGLEASDAVREAAYGYRPDEASESAARDSVS